MGNSKSIIQNKDFLGIVRWIDAKWKTTVISLIAAFVASAIWMLVASFFGMLYLSGFINSIRGVAKVSHRLDSQSFIFTFILVLAFQVGLGFWIYFTHRFNPRGNPGEANWNDIHNSGINQMALEGYLPERHYYGYGAGPAAHIFVFLMWIFLLFLGPGIFVYTLIESQFILEMQNPNAKTNAAIALLKLFRMCGEPTAVETLDIPGLNWGDKLLVLGKLQRLRWVYLSKDLAQASLESDIDQKLRDILGYR